MPNTVGLYTLVSDTSKIATGGVFISSSRSHMKGNILWDIILKSYQQQQEIIRLQN